jgi:hypothetical protein
MGKFRTSSYTSREWFNGKHRFEHWYRDNTIYFTTSKVREGFRAFESGIVRVWHDYPFTHRYIDLDERIEWAVANRCFLEKVPYARYDRRTARRGRLSDHA